MKEAKRKGAHVYMILFLKTSRERKLTYGDRKPIGVACRLWWVGTDYQGA